MISRGGGPRTLCDVTCSDKQMGEVKRVLAWRHKSAEPIEVERAGTSDPVSGSACKPAMRPETESMVDASVEYGTCQLGSRQDNFLCKQGVGGVLVCAGVTRTGGLRVCPALETSSLVSLVSAIQTDRPCPFGSKKMKSEKL